MASRIKVAKVSDIPNKEARTYPVGDRMIAIFNQDGIFHAMDDFCPHMGASLAEGWIEDGTIACPWHAWRFSLKDGCWLDNPKIQIDLFRVFVEEDDVVVEFDDE